MKQFGFPVGPAALFDEVGIDVGAHVAEVLGNTFEKRGAKTSKKAAELVEAGYKGRKNEHGFYKYADGKKKIVNQEIYSFFGGASRKEMDNSDIQQRLTLMMVNEAIYCLQENILLSPADGDLGAILGLGFPPFTGGPFNYADSEGAKKLVEKMNQFTEKFGNRFKPANLLVEKAESGSAFHS